MSGNRCPASRSVYSPGIQASSPVRRCERRNGNRGVRRHTTPTVNGVVSMSLEVLIPKFLDPLQKFEIISDAGEMEGVEIDQRGNVLHFAFNKLFYENGLRGRQVRFAAQRNSSYVPCRLFWL